MKKHIQILLTTLFFAVTTVYGQPQKNIEKTNTGSLTLNFRNVIDGKPLILNDTAFRYQNLHGDPFKVTTFKYYISNVSLIKGDGSVTLLPETYLYINAADTSTLVQHINNVPLGTYKTISFIIGVDSSRNFAGAQTGALDPVKGMFWSWNSGYIFVKFEGNSPKSTARKHTLTFHIGGVTDPHNTIRTFSQLLPQSLNINSGKNSALQIITDASYLFKGESTVDFADLNFTMGGAESVEIADNYINGLFKIEKVN